MQSHDEVLKVLLDRYADESIGEFEALCYFQRAVAIRAGRPPLGWLEHELERSWNTTRLIPDSKAAFGQPGTKTKASDGDFARDFNVGIRVTGEVAVLDIDHAGWRSVLSQLPSFGTVELIDAAVRGIVLTPRGAHYYFKYKPSSSRPAVPPGRWKHAGLPVTLIYQSGHVVAPGSSVGGFIYRPIDQLFGPRELPVHGVPEGTDWGFPNPARTGPDWDSPRPFSWDSP